MAKVRVSPLLRRPALAPYTIPLVAAFEHMEIRMNIYSKSIFEYLFKSMDVGCSGVS